MHKPFRLKGPIGLEYNMDLGDTLNTKRALNDLGFMSLPNYGLTTYPDQPMIDGVRSFQRRHGLREDGVMKPDGPTLGRLNQTLAERQPTSKAPNPLSKVPLPTQRNLLSSVLKPPKPLTRTPVSLDSASTGSTEKAGDKQQAAAIAIPPIVYKIAEFFGMAVMAAWAWWQAMSTAERGKVRRQVEGGKSDDSEGDDCDHLHFYIDIPTCNAISRKRGKQAAVRCYASANERYAACRRGVPKDQLPPLDVWDN